LKALLFKFSLAPLFRKSVHENNEKGHPKQIMNVAERTIHKTWFIGFIRT